MFLLLPTKAEAQTLVSQPRDFRGLAFCEGALPPTHILMVCLLPESTDWLMPRLYGDELTGQIVGSGGYKSAPKDRIIEIGYNVAPACRGQGYATQGVRLLVALAFASGFVDVVEAGTTPTNVASRRVLQKAGFTANDRVSRPEGEIDLWVIRR